MTRSEHVEWCKQRALAYLPENVGDALASMASDMNKHEETRQVFQGPVGTVLVAEMLQCDTPDKARRWIEGFN